MKHTILAGKLLAGTLLLCFCSATQLQAQGTAFTYQGRLNNNGATASGSYDMAFTLFPTNTAGTAIAGPVTNTAVTVSNGLFTTTVDFGSVFNGASNWLQISVSTNGANAFSTLSPRQRLTPVPYAIYSELAGYSSTAGLAASVTPGSITASMLAPGAVSDLGTPNGIITNAVVVSTNGLVGIGTGTSNLTAGLQINSSGSETILSVLSAVPNGAYGFTNISPANQPAINNNLLAIAGGDGLTLASLTNPSAPQLLSQTAGNGIFTNLNGSQSVAWAGSNVVVAASSSSSITIFSCTNPANPIAISQELNGVGGWNYLNGAVSVAASGNLIAVAALTSSAVTLADISNPSAPQLKSTMINGSFGFTNLGGAVSVALSGNLLAVGAFNSNAVTLVNVSDPTNPQKLAELRNGFGGFTNLNGVYSVAMSGNLLAIAGAYSSAVTLVDVSNPSSPVKLAELRDGVGGYSIFEPVAVALSSNRLIIGGAADTVTLVDISTPSSPVLLSTARYGINGANYIAIPVGMAFAGTNFVVCGNSGAFTIFGATAQSVGMDSSGWVGIGTTHPQAALDVEGSVVIENANWFTVSAVQIALGSYALASGFQATAVGDQATAAGTNSLALGYNADASSDYSIAMGYDSVANNTNAMAVGNNSHAYGQEASALGFDSFATGDYSTCVGNYSDAQGLYAAALGNYADASAYNSTAVGNDVSATAQNATALGYYSSATGTNSSAIGSQADATGFASTALGYGSHATGDYSLAGGYAAYATNKGAIVLSDGFGVGGFTSTNINEFAVRATGGVRLVTSVDGSGNPIAGVKLYPGGTAWATISDQNAKKNFTAIDVKDVVNRLASIPVEKWNYKWESDTNTPNIGPMAQAFKSAFYPGRDDKSITTLEFDGVELAAIQGLNQKLEEQQAENKELKARLEKLEQSINGKNGGAK